MNFSPQIIGLTGPYCSGKSTVQKILEKKGFETIDVDKIGHHALVMKKNEIAALFGETILSGNEIDRKKLGKIVFNDRKKLKALNAVVHPFMTDIVGRTIRDSHEKKICINAALLFEMGLDGSCGTIIVVRASLFNIIRRSRKRDKYPVLRILKILLNQKVISIAKKKSATADIFYINNNFNQMELERSIDRILSERNLI